MESEARATKERPEAKHDERHGHNKDGQHAKIAKVRTESRQSIGRVDRRLTAIDRLYCEIRAPKTQAGQSEPGDDRICTQLLDHQPEKCGSEDTEHYRQA